MRPSPGRVVHYVPDTHPSFVPCQAAMVTEVTPGGGAVLPATVSLTVFGPDGFAFEHDVRQDEAGRRPGTWHWPERVPE